eukprot:GDKI01033176.1.p2 GENE.GDKI01033176.1~~GDKI01033176.1.p2  ORF type:complete len:116 (-),score=19.84 GDKI01033176.1:212-535(-)
MALFCPSDGTLLLVENVGGNVRFFCKTCPYIFKLQEKATRKVPLERKKVDDVLGGDDAWSDAPKTEAVCPQCSHKEAYFRQIQIRSADEPTTTFYRCVKCARHWRED